MTQREKRTVQSIDDLANMIESVANGVRRGNTTFIAMSVISRNLIDPSKPLVMVCSLDGGASPEKVALAFAEMAEDAQKIGALVPD